MTVHRYGTVPLRANQDEADAGRGSSCAGPRAMSVQYTKRRVTMVILLKSITIMTPITEINTTAGTSTTRGGEAP